MKLLYHFFQVFIDFFFPLPEEIIDIHSLPKNKTILGNNITALFSYQDQKVKEVVWQIKYYKNEKICSDLAYLIYEKILSLHIPTPFIIVPIPMSETAKKQRGYNQTEFLAERLLPLFRNSECAGISYDLCKKYTSQSQHTLERSQRIEHAKHLFFVENKNCFAGKNVLILDDVITTGSTMREAIRIARENNAREVVAIAIAH